MFLGWQNKPWKLVTDQGDVDLWPFIEQFFIGLNGKLARRESRLDGCTIALDETSEYRFSYKSGPITRGPILDHQKNSGFINVYAYFENDLVWLSGRVVEIEVSDTELKLTADSSELVHGVYFTGEGNSCAVSADEVRTICKAGQEDCCVFLGAGGGFSCEKFNGPMARYWLDRLAKGTIRATRVGNCAILRRKETEDKKS